MNQELKLHACENGDYFFNPSHSLNALSKGFISDDDDDDLTIISNSSKDGNVKIINRSVDSDTTVCSPAKTDSELSDESKILDERPIMKPHSNFHHEQDDASSFDQSLTDISSLPDTFFTKADCNNSILNKTDNLQLQLRKEMLNLVQSFKRIHVKNRRGSDCTVTHRRDANREMHYRLEYSRRHSTDNSPNNGNAIHYGNDDTDNDSYLCKTTISHRTNNSVRLRAIPARRIERIKSISTFSKSCQKEPPRSLLTPNEISSDAANQHLFSGSYERIFQQGDVDNSTVSVAN